MNGNGAEDLAARIELLEQKTRRQDDTQTQTLAEVRGMREDLGAFKTLIANELNRLYNAVMNMNGSG